MFFIVARNVNPRYHWLSQCRIFLIWLKVVRLCAAGTETMNGRITGKGIYQTVKQLRQYFDITDEFMKKYGLSESSMLYMNFNIEVKVKYLK